MTIIEKEFMETIVRNLPKLVRELADLNANLKKVNELKEKESTEKE